MTENKRYQEMRKRKMPIIVWVSYNPQDICIGDAWSIEVEESHKFIKYKSVNDLLKQAMDALQPHAYKGSRKELNAFFAIHKLLGETK